MLKTKQSYSTCWSNRSWKDNNNCKACIDCKNYSQTWCWINFDWYIQTWRYRPIKKFCRCEPYWFSCSIWTIWNASINEKFSKKDIVFIDTVGRNHKNDAQLKTNLDFLESVKIDETFLVLSATSSTRNLIEIAKKFKIFNYGAFIMSKIDEAVVHGNIINLSTKTGSPIAF